jgi:phospholipase C
MMPALNRYWLVLATGLIVAGLTLLGGSAGAKGATIKAHPEVAGGGPRGTYIVPPGIHKIKHVVVIMQENRSFDTYFGTFPGADGIPMKNGEPTVCVPDPNPKATNKCVAPYRDHSDMIAGGPHGAANFRADLNGGKMDGFIKQAEGPPLQIGCHFPQDPACAHGGPEVMGYHTQSDIPNYWAYARDFVLQDHMFEPDSSWSLPVHLSWCLSGRPIARRTTPRAVSTTTHGTNISTTYR